MGSYIPFKKLQGLGFQGLQFNYPAMMMVPLFGIGGMLLRGINQRLNSSTSNILQQLVDIPNNNVNYLLQNLFKKKQQRSMAMVSYKVLI
jgi:hypothetical protein